MDLPKAVGGVLGLFTASMILVGIFSHGWTVIFALVLGIIGTLIVASVFAGK